GSQEQQAQPHPQEDSSHSWYPPPGVSSTNSSRPSTPGSSASNSFNLQRPSERPHSPSQVSPSEAAGIIALLKDKSVDELRKLLSDKDAYNQFLLSVDQVKIQNNVSSKKLSLFYLISPFQMKNYALFVFLSLRLVMCSWFVDLSSSIKSYGLALVYGIN
ncbi:hypothetical protein Goshw_026457, partial [Gossypium schwendimanii]|nr:hypothetical protein [Gossypium schwendimanii]